MDQERWELDRALLGDAPSKALSALVENGWAAQHLPELVALRMDQPAGWRHKDVYQHTLAVVENSAALGGDLVDLLAALFHDLAKPETRAFEPGGTVTFHGHDLIGSRVARRRLTQLGYDFETTKMVADLTALHLRAFGYFPGKWTDAGLRRFDVETGVLQERALRLMRSDITTGRPEKRAKILANLDDLEERLRDVRRRDALGALRPAVTGNEVMTHLGIGPGPQVGAVMRELLAAVRRGEHLSRDEALALAEAVHRSQLSN